MPPSYPVTFSVDYPERKLNRLSTFFRIFAVIPIAIVAALLPGAELAGNAEAGGAGFSGAVAGASLVVLPLVLMLLFRKKYPRWWYDWNLELMRFGNRIGVYVALMDDQYPSTDEQQAVHLDFAYPDVERLERGLPLVKWLLAIPHYIVLGLLLGGAGYAAHESTASGGFGLIGVLVLVAGVGLLFTGRYPQRLFDLILGLNRWVLRVAAYVALMTDEYPPFALDQGGHEPATSRPRRSSPGPACSDT